MTENVSKKYKCCCGWVGTEEEMEAAYCELLGGGEDWSNWICPGCGVWNILSDYEELLDSLERKNGE